MATEVFIKDPAETLDYDFDWKPLANGKKDAESDWLSSGESIASHAASADTGLTVEGSSESDGIVKIWVSGGEDGNDYVLSCKITTDNSPARIAERSIIIRVEEDKG